MIENGKPSHDAEKMLHSEETTWSIFDGEAIILNLENGMYYHLNGVASRIWELCDGTREAREIADAICCEYDVDRDRALDDAARILRTFTEQGLIMVGKPLADRQQSRFPEE
jgi:pyrroloquinoline quinone biosynthesis protein D